MRNCVLAASSILLLCACAGSEATPALTISPSGAQTINGPTLITASQAGVTWSLTGPGTLSGATGRETVYRPPVPVTGAPTATVTATLSGQTATVTFTVNPMPAAIPGGTIAGLHGPVQVEYDPQQIPHIFCGNALDCYAVQGFVTAQDRLFEMDLVRRTARGQLASLVGPVELSSDEQFLTLFVTRDGHRIEDNLAAALDTNTRAIIDAYVSGVNAYLAFLAAHPGLMPGEYAQLPGVVTPGDIPPWTEQDTLAIGRLQQFQLSESIEEESGYGLIAATFAAGTGHPYSDTSTSAGRFPTYVRSPQPVKSYTLDEPDTNLPGAPPSQVQSAAVDMSAWAPGLAAVNSGIHQMRETFGVRRLGAGSNNWVVDAAHSATGKAMVANDPHLALYYPPIFYLSAMTATDSSGLDVVGGSFTGVPGALVGRGAHVGWGVTVVGYDVTDLYMEQVDPTCGPVPCVVFKTNKVPTIPVQYTIKQRGAADAHFTVLVVPHHGPIIQYDPVHDPTHAISMRWTGHETTADEKAFLGLNTAASVDAAFTALKDFATGAQNFVLADDQGSIGYDPHALVPRRPWASTGSPPKAPWLPLPGDGSAEWGSGNPADNCAGTGANPPAAACWIPDAQLPQAKNPAKGYLATANSDPIGYSAAGSVIFPNPFGDPGTFYLSFDWDDPTAVRYARIATLLKAKTANGGKVAVADMQAIQSDHVVLLAKLFAPYFPASITGTNAAAYTAALGLLTQWGADGYDCPTGLTSSDPKSAPDTDPTHVRDSAACLLFHVTIEQLLHSVFDDDFALVAATQGQNPGTDGARQLRAMLYMLSLSPGTAGTEFCNDIDTSGNTIATHACADKLVKALLTAAGLLNASLGAPPANWIWGRQHTLTTRSAAAPLIANGFAQGPYARPGGAFTVDVGNPDGSQSTPFGQSYSHGSNVRLVATMDASTSATVKMQLPGAEHDGPSGLFASTPDLLGQYVNNQYFDYLMNHQVDAAAVSVQGFTAP